MEDVSAIYEWDVSKVENMDMIFGDCSSLKETPEWSKIKKIQEEITDGQTTPQSSDEETDSQNTDEETDSQNTDEE